MDSDRAWELLCTQQVAVLATIRPDGLPRLVPFVFAPLERGRLISAVDHKPKENRRLARLADLESNPQVAVLVHHYEADWSRLWWVRGEGTATVSDMAAEEAAAALVARYRQYGEQPPQGPWIHLTLGRLSGWEASQTPTQG